MGWRALLAIMHGLMLISVAAGFVVTMTSVLAGAPAQTRAELFITLTPPDAQVRLRGPYGEIVAPTDLPRALPTGQYHLTVYRDGYKERELPVVLTKGKRQDVDIVLAKEDLSLWKDLRTWLVFLGGLIGSLIATVVTWRVTTKTRVERTVDSLTREWWDVGSLQRAIEQFYSSYLQEYKKGVRPKTMTEVWDNGYCDVVKLAQYFDRVGWLAASKLVNPALVLGPMSHTIRRLWFVLEEPIRGQRTIGWGGYHDEVYHLGLEWLFQLTKLPKYSHAKVINKVFGSWGLGGRRPALNSLRGIEGRMGEDEERFLNSIGGQFQGRNAQSANKNGKPSAKV